VSAIRNLARLVVEADGSLDDLCELARLCGLADEWSPIADLTDGELLAMFPGSQLIDDVMPEQEEEVASCGCKQRRSEWRLAGPAVEVRYTSASGEKFREAARHPVEDRGVVAQSKESGWIYETTLLGRGHAWTCALCHPPAPGVEIEHRELMPESAPVGRLRWQHGYGWRRGGEPPRETLR